MLALWVFLLMTSLQPAAPWRDRYLELANAIADASIDDPVFAGEDGPGRTAALLVSIAYFESNFNPAARGDGGQSCGAFQISRVWAPCADLMDPTKGAQVALRLVRESFRTCSRRPQPDRLAWYAAGGPVCSSAGVQKSRHRWALAMRLTGN